MRWEEEVRLSRSLPGLLWNPGSALCSLWTPSFVQGRGWTSLVTHPKASIRPEAWFALWVYSLVVLFVRLHVHAGSMRRGRAVAVLAPCFGEASWQQWKGKLSFPILSLIVWLWASGLSTRLHFLTFKVEVIVAMLWGHWEVTSGKHLELAGVPRYIRVL